MKVQSWGSAVVCTALIAAVVILELKGLSVPAMLTASLGLALQAVLPSAVSKSPAPELPASSSSKDGAS